MRVIPIVLAALLLNAGLSFAASDDTYLECKYGGIKSFYKKSKIFKVTHDGHVYDGDLKMKLNRESVIDSYLFGSATNDNEMLMHSIDIFNGNWRQYIITKDEIFRIKNDEEITKSKLNSYAGLDWEHAGECKSIVK